MISRYEKKKIKVTLFTIGMNWEERAGIRGSAISRMVSVKVSEESEEEGRALSQPKLVIPSYLAGRWVKVQSTVVIVWLSDKRYTFFKARL